MVQGGKEEQCTALSCIGFTSPRIYVTWKKEWASQVEYQGIVQDCREAIRKAKAQLKLKLVGDLKDEKESFYSTLSAKVKQRKTGACCGAGALVTEKKKNQPYPVLSLRQLLLIKCAHAQLLKPCVRPQQ